jgi:hypothetical protein
MWPGRKNCNRTKRTDGIRQIHNTDDIRKEQKDRHEHTRSAEHAGFDMIN